LGVFSASSGDIPALSSTQTMPVSIFSTYIL
jgi:hypothetical protein